MNTNTLNLTLTGTSLVRVNDWRPRDRYRSKAVRKTREGKVVAVVAAHRKVIGQMTVVEYTEVKPIPAHLQSK